MNNNELEKIKLLLEEKDFEQAKDMLDELISIDHKNSKAYLYLLLIKYKVSNIDELINLATPINHEKLFILSYKYADSFEKQQLNELCKNIENKIEDIKLSKYYEEALGHFHNNEYERSMKEFGYLNNYKDSKIYFEKAKDAILNEKYVHAENLLVQGQISEAILIFYELKDYKDSGERYLELKKKRDAEGNYNLAIQECSSNAPDQIKRGIMRLRTLENYKESEILITQYTRKLLQIEHEKDIKLQQNKKRNRTLLVVIILLFSLLVGIVSLIIPAYRYNNAMQYLESGDFQQAKEAFLDLGNYRDRHLFCLG